MVYNVHYDVCALMIAACTIAFILVKKGLLVKTNRILMILALFTFGAAFFDIISSVVNSNPGQLSYGIQDFFNYTYLLLHNGMTYLFLIYAASACGLFYGNENRKRIFFIFSIPYGIDLIILGLNPILHWAFYYDANRIYTHGKIFYVLYAVAFLYLIYSVCVVYKYGKNVTRGKRIMCYVFVLSSLLSVMIQMFIPNVLISLCVNSLALLGVLLVIDNEDEIIEPISKCFNRRIFVQNNMVRIGHGIHYNTLSVKILQLNLHTATLGISLTNQFIEQVGKYLKKLNVEVYCYANGAFALLYTKDNMTDELIQQIKQRFSENWNVNDTVLQLEAEIQQLKVGKEINSVEEMLISLDYEAGVTDKNTQKAISVLDYRRQSSVERAIKRALVTDGIVVEYQPVWNIKSNMITRAKTIVHIKDDELGELNSKEFMEVAEKNELSNEIGRIVLQKVCQSYKERDLATLGIDVIEIDISRLQCMNVNLKEQIIDILEEYDVDRSHIEFLVPLGTLMENQEVMIANLNELQKSGIRLSFIRYGSEWMRMMDILQYSMNGIHIDGFIFEQMMTQDRVNTFIRNSIRMFHELDLEITVEGVDDVYSKDRAIDLRCDYISGNYFSKPVDEEGFYRYCKGFNLR